MLKLTVVKSGNLDPVTFILSRAFPSSELITTSYTGIDRLLTPFKVTISLDLWYFGFKFSILAAPCGTKLLEEPVSKYAHMSLFWILTGIMEVENFFQGTHYNH